MVTIARFMRAIRALPSDEPRNHPDKWYTTQKEHWIGWLGEYSGAGAYGRKTETRRDAEFAYNHIVEVRMLLWLAEAAGVHRNLIAKARNAAKHRSSLQAKAAAVRRIIPWSEIAAMLWDR